MAGQGRDGGAARSRRLHPVQWTRLDVARSPARPPDVASIGRNTSRLSRLSTWVPRPFADAVATARDRWVRQRAVFAIGLSA